jgi:hypothetical protein
MINKSLLIHSQIKEGKRSKKEIWGGLGLGNFNLHNRRFLTIHINQMPQHTTYHDHMNNTNAMSSAPKMLSVKKL